jgi:hypothetical protein
MSVATFLVSTLIRFLGFESNFSKFVAFLQLFRLFLWFGSLYWKGVNVVAYLNLISFHYFRFVQRRDYNGLLWDGIWNISVSGYRFCFGCPLGAQRWLLRFLSIIQNLKHNVLLHLLFVLELFLLALLILLHKIVHFRLQLLLTSQRV